MPLIFEIPPAAEVLGAMITPAVLISASGTLALSTSNRLGRVVDRVRTLSKEIDETVANVAIPPDEYEEKCDLIMGTISRLARRMRYLQTALTILYSSIGLLVGTSLTVGLTAATRLLPHLVPVALGLLGATGLLAASVLLVRETRLAVHSSMIEMAHVRSLAARKLSRHAVPKNLG